jgi:hypothetical protein
MDTARRNRIAVVAALAISAVAAVSFVLLLLFQSSDSLPTPGRTVTVHEALTITRKSNPETTEIQSNVQIRDWMGWVTMIETGKADGGATVGVYLGDPYAVESAPVITSTYFRVFPAEPDAHLAISGEETRALSVGDQVRFSGTIQRVGPYPELIINVETLTRLGPDRTAYELPEQDLEITLERALSGFDSDCCTAYRVKITGDRVVGIIRRDYSGNSIGEVETSVTKEQLSLLAYEVERAGFFRFQSAYPQPLSLICPLSSTDSISVRLGDTWNSSAFDYGSEHPHARRLYILAAKIDEIVNVKQWLKQE